MQLMARMQGRDSSNRSHRGKANDNYEQFVELKKDNMCGTISTVQKDNVVIEKVRVKQATKKGYVTCIVGGVADLNYIGSKTRRGRVQDEGKTCPTLTTENIPSVLEPYIYEIDGELYLIRIRKLTPRECWRLMSFSDCDFEKAQAVNSNTQLYSQAGNSIVEDVLKQIIQELL